MAVEEIIIGDKEEILNTVEELSNVEMELNKIANFTYSEMETYVENNVTDLASSKVYLKELSRTVLGLTKLIKKKYY